MDTKVGRRALNQLSERMNQLNVEFGELALNLEKLKASDFESDWYDTILDDAQLNRIRWRECQDEVNRLIELEQYLRLIK